MLRYLRYLLRTLCETIRPHLPKVPVWAQMLLLPHEAEWYICFAKGMRKISCLPQFCGKTVFFLPANTLLANFLFQKCTGTCFGVLMWGKKEYAPKDLPKEYKNPLQKFWATKKLQKLAASRTFALAFAKKNSLPILRLEDGFLRSVNLGVLGAKPLSLVFDTTGIYYDATCPSDLETRLNSDWQMTDLERIRAKDALATICKQYLSKYNHAPLAPQLVFQEEKHVLVLDQTFGDISIRLGMAEDATFARMLDCAIRDNPGSSVFVKIHPDVLSGKKKGHFLPKNLPNGVHILAEDYAPLSLLAQFDVIYTVTSQMGFEALFLGKKVYTFGMPFYAGWGLTNDAIQCPRRTKKRSLIEVFWAAYGLYARYADLALHQPTTLERVLIHLKTQRDIYLANAGFHAVYGFRNWKKPHARAFLKGANSQIEFFTSLESAADAAKKHKGNLVLWSSKCTKENEKYLSSCGVPIVRMEDGFIRSVGLGSNHFRPGSLVLDDLGIYYDPNKPSRLEVLLQEERTSDELAYAKTVIDTLTHFGISKYNIKGKCDLPKLPKDKRILLVPGQVEDDASVRLGGLGIHSNADLLASVRKKNPDAYIIYKEHPDVVSGNRIGLLPKDTQSLADAYVATAPIEYVLSKCTEVHTLTSQTGFEALLRGISVTTYGGPFYAGWGLTHDRVSLPRRKKKLTLLELVAGTLLLYPRYYIWESQMFVDCKTFIDYLAKLRAKV